MKHAIVVGLGWGDEAKGSITDYLVRQHGAKTVVRFSGGAQCGHTVVTEDGRRHVFAQFGSGTFVPGVRTFLSRHVLVNPMNLKVEGEALQKLGVEDAFDRMYISESARVITPFHVAVNRIKEFLRGSDRHGSCGMGIGETVADSLEHPWQALRLGHLRYGSVGYIQSYLYHLQAINHKKVEASWQNLADPSPIQKEIGLLCCDGDLIRQMAEDYQEMAHRVHVSEDLAQFLEESPVIFEGAQGVLLDEEYGFQPHNTWTKTTFANAEELLQENGRDRQDWERIGVLRAYSTRHGAGPFPARDSALVAQAGETNVFNTWQQGFQLGYFDSVMARYALQVAGTVDSLALTCLDYPFPQGEYRAIESYSPHVEIGPQATDALRSCRPDRWFMTHSEAEFLNHLEDSLETPIGMVSHGPVASDKTVRQSAFRRRQAA